VRPSLVVVAALVAACARIEPPPGGPIDRAPPFLRSIYPDSLRTLPDFDEDVAFEFDEVVSEGSQPNFGLGSGDLEKLIVLSPSNEVPEVRWKRSRITVRPKEGWRPTPSTAELLAGVADLSRNLTGPGRGDVHHRRAPADRQPEGTRGGLDNPAGGPSGWSRRCSARQPCLPHDQRFHRALCSGPPRGEYRTGS
jgi:hypothetical protein